VLTALTLGQRFGIVAMLQNSIPRHLRYLGAMGMMDRFAGDVPVNLTIAEMADDRLTLDRMIVVGRNLRDTHHADVLVMGCAGMARFREALEQELGIPIVEPTQAAVTMAIGRVRLGWGGRPVRGRFNPV
jgi:allantoin racemase